MPHCPRGSRQIVGGIVGRDSGVQRRPCRRRRPPRTSTRPAIVCPRQGRRQGGAEQQHLAVDRARSTSSRPGAANDSSPHSTGVSAKRRADGSEDRLRENQHQFRRRCGPGQPSHRDRPGRRAQLRVAGIQGNTEASPWVPVASLIKPGVVEKLIDVLKWVTVDGRRQLARS